MFSASVNRIRSTRFIPGLLVLGLLVLACGGGESDASGSTTGSTGGAEAEPTTTTAASEESVVTTAEPAIGIDCADFCNIAMDGDSLTQDLGERLCLEVATGNCINSGVAGERVDQMLASAPSEVDVQAGDGGDDVLILWGGTNDLWQRYHDEDPAANAEAVYAVIEQYLDERRAAGWDYTFVVTIPSMNPDEIAGREELNALIRANAAGADAIIDLDAEPRLADPFDAEHRTPDGIHLTVFGLNVVGADYLVPAIRSLDGS